jgi:hypothetical protein
MHFVDLSAARSATPELSNIFQGSRFAFPWTATGGTHRCSTCRSVKFISLPKNPKRASGFDPIVLWREGLEYKMMYPKGTLTGEVLLMRVGEEEVVFEMRVRERDLTQWNADAFRPFPESGDFHREIQQVHAETKDPKAGEAAEWALKQETIQPADLNDQFGIFQESAAVDSAPAFEPGLVKRLLTKTKFKSAYGKVWKHNRKVLCHAPTFQSGVAVLKSHNPSTDVVSFVPENYDAAFISVDEVSCARCHATGGNRIGQYAPSADLYGQIWGFDQVFSFHPFRNENVMANADYSSSDLRPELFETHTVEYFDPAVHGEDAYKRIAPQ